MKLGMPVVVSALLAFLCVSVRGAENSEETASMTPVALAVLSAPTAVRGSDDMYHLVYELQLRNAASVRTVIERVEVRDAAAPGRLLLALGSDAIAARLQLGARGKASNALGPFQFGTLFLHVAIKDGAAVPKKIVHHIDIFGSDLPPDLQHTTSIGGEVLVGSGPVAVLGPPLRGGRYIAADGCCDSLRHIRALLPLNGGLYLAQRYAIDWERLDEQNRVFVGDPHDPRSYHIYGEEVLAVADATVERAVDGKSEPTPGALPQGLPVREADGNHVILALSGGVYVLYAHLQPGSIRVARGQRVRRGDVLGRVGNSGNSSAPHLHLHAMDRPSGLIANGVPYVYDSYRITGIDKAGTTDFDHAEQTGDPASITSIVPARQMHESLPMDLSVVRWPG
jgi:hypothetical protein